MTDQPTSLLCPNCGYDLQGNSEATDCPECGYTFADGAAKPHPPHAWWWTRLKRSFVSPRSPPAFSISMYAASNSRQRSRSACVAAFSGMALGWEGPAPSGTGFALFSQLRIGRT